nr:hypothetical protein [Tanacetum cinerariifolium]
MYTFTLPAKPPSSVTSHPHPFYPTTSSKIYWVKTLLLLHYFHNLRKVKSHNFRAKWRVEMVIQTSTGLDQGPRVIFKSKSKVRQSRAKAVVAKVSTSSSAPAISFDVDELKDMVRVLLLDKKNQSSALANLLLLLQLKHENVYRDNIEEYLSQATIANYNQGNTEFRPQMVANQIRPPSFPSIQTHQNNQNNFNRGNNFNQNRGGNFNQGGSGTLPSNTITNPKEELKGITTRSDVAYQGPTIPTPSKVMKQGTEVTKDQVQTPSSTLIPKLKSFIPYPSRRDNERRRDQANEQIEKFYEIFKDMSFEIRFTDALILMHKFASTLKALIGNKEKLSEMARTPMNEHCSTVILNKLPRKLGDPSKFLIPCEFPGMDECLVLADLGASINLMPLWEGLPLSELTLTYMILELAGRLVSKPIGIAKDVSVKVGVFHFPADFVVVDFEPDPRVPLLLRRCFLKTDRALIDVHKGELTLRIENEAITYNLDQTSRYSANYNQMTANKIDVIDLACEEYSQEVLGFFDVTTSGNPTPYDDPIISTTSPTLTPFGDSDFLLFEEADTFLAILNSEPLPPLPNHEQYMHSFKKELKVCEAKTIKSSVDEPPKVELKDLPPHLEYVFLEGDNKFPVIIAKELGNEEKFALIKILMEEDYKPAVQHQRRVNPKIHDVIKKEVEKLLDDGLIYSISDSPWVSLVHCVPKKGGFTVVKNEENELIPTRLVTGWQGTNTIVSSMVSSDKMLQRCEDTNLCLNWEKSHFMVKEGIVPGHKISKNGIKVDKAKVNVIAKLPHPTTVKAVVYAFGKLRSYLIMNKSIVHTDHFALKYLFAKKDAKARLLRWVLLLQEFDFKVLDTKGAGNLAVDHLSRLENPYENMLDPKEINETFPLETLSMVTFLGDSSASWFEDFANYHADQVIRRCVHDKEALDILEAVDYLSKWVEAKALPTNDARVVCKFRKSLFARFGAP